ncbi:MAG: TIGR04086 family membrane protein [Agathobacter sp.]|nr:TIGR04086 family membrane protein [Agathobacter sp.]
MSDLQTSGNLEKETEEQPKKKVQAPRWIAAFLGILFMECALAAALLLSMTYAAFRLRLSAEMIRAGIVVVYALPCLVGGFLVRWLKLEPSLLWGVGAGAAYYGVLLAVSAAATGQMMSGWEIPILCVASALAGLFLRKKRRIERKSASIE